MNRSNYSDDIDNWGLIRWRGQVASSIKGRRGQAFLRELVEALDMMPDKRLIAEDLQRYDGEVCALGSVGLKRGMTLKSMDPEDNFALASAFGITHQLVREIEWMNDEGCGYLETSHERWKCVRDWAVSKIHKERDAPS